MLSATGCQPWGRGGLVCSPVLLSRFPFPLFLLSRALYIIMCVFRFISFFPCRYSLLSLFFLFFRKKVRKKFAVSENSVTFALAFAHFGASAFRFSRLHGKSSLKVFHRRGSSTGRPFAFLRWRRCDEPSIHPSLCGAVPLCGAVRYYRTGVLRQIIRCALVSLPAFPLCGCCGLLGYGVSSSIFFLQCRV